MQKTIIYAAITLFTVSCHEAGKDGVDTSSGTTTTATTGPHEAVSAVPTTVAAVTSEPSVSIAGVGTCTPDAELSSTVSRLLAMADENGDGQISKDEATNVANFLVGGFFFKADTNNDGVVTPEEGRRERAKFVQDHPAVASFFARANKSVDGHPFASVASVLGIDYGKPLSMSEARSAAHSGVEDLFRVADLDHDGRVGPTEFRKVALEGVRAGEHAVFQGVDTDHNGDVSLAEFEAALQAPTKVAFDAADTNKNGQLTEAEATAAMAQLATRVGALDLIVAK